MPRYETQDIRNVVLVGHNGSGKTSLAEAMLFRAKATNRLGSVDEGTSVFDFEPEERERKTSIDLAAAFFEASGREVNLLDAPGYPDFIGESISGLYAAETALICVDAADGIRVNTGKVWQLAGKLGRARILVLNRMDQENARYLEVVRSLRENFGKECVPVFLPRGSGPDLAGGVDLLRGPGEAPEDLKDLAREAFEKLMECDDGLLEKYLEGGSVSSEDLARVLPRALAQGKVVPILFTSVKKDVGVAELIDFLVRFAPSPRDVPPPVGEDPEKGGSLTREVGGPFSARVFKSVADPFVQRLSYVRLYSGTMSADQPLYHQRLGRAVRIGGMFKPFGRELRPCPSAAAGEIVCLTKVEGLNTGDTLCDPQQPIRYPPLEFPASMVSLAVEPKTKQDLARMSESMQKMADSDPTFKFTRDRATGELVITGRSKLHIEIVLARLKRKFDVQVTTKAPKLALKETVLVPAEGHHKHKKQTGGHGQYGEVYLRVRPTARGEGFRFTDSITQGRIPQQFVPAIEKGIRKTCEKGIVAGYPVVDVEVEVYDGSYHEVDSGPGSFELAGSKAFKDAFVKARPVLLEPIVNIEITVPSRFMGDITGDLNSRRGRILGMDSRGNLSVVRAQIPMMEIMDYETQLRSVTGGEGSYSVDPSHYDILPQKIAEAVIARAQKAEEKEEE